MKVRFTNGIKDDSKGVLANKVSDHDYVVQYKLSVLLFQVTFSTVQIGRHWHQPSDQMILSVDGPCVNRNRVHCRFMDYNSTPGEKKKKGDDPNNYQK